MKTIKWMVLAAVMAVLGVNARAQGSLADTFNDSATGTVAGVVFVPRSDGIAEVTDLAVYSTNLLTRVDVYPSSFVGYITTSSPSGSTNLLTTFTNIVRWGDYVIIGNSTNAAAKYQMLFVQSVSSTNIGVAGANIARTQAVNEPFWVVRSEDIDQRFGLSVWNYTPGASTGAVWSSKTSIYLPADKPSGLIATNATAADIKININGRRLLKD